MEVIREGTGSCIIALRGRFDANECDEFDTYVDALRTSGHKDLRFDLSGVDFIDSTALASLVALSKSTTAEGHTMEILNPSDPVRVILELTAIDRVLKIVDEPAPTR